MRPYKRHCNIWPGREKKNAVCAAERANGQPLMVPFVAGQLAHGPGICTTFLLDDRRFDDIVIKFRTDSTVLCRNRNDRPIGFWVLQCFAVD